MSEASDTAAPPAAIRTVLAPSRPVERAEGRILGFGMAALALFLALFVVLPLATVFLRSLYEGQTNEAQQQKERIDAITGAKK